MYCPSCGIECQIGLNYCNRCGANLGALTTQAEVVQINLTKPALIIGIVLTVLTLGGFGMLIGGARALAEVIHGNDPLIAMIFLGMLIILTVDIFLLRQLTKLINAALKPGAPTQSRNQINSRTEALPRPTTTQLPMPSVTENTTRFLESDYREPVEIRNQKQNR